MPMSLWDAQRVCIVVASMMLLTATSTSSAVPTVGGEVVCSSAMLQKGVVECLLELQYTTMSTARVTFPSTLRNGEGAAIVSVLGEGMTLEVVVRQQPLLVVTAMNRSSYSNAFHGVSLVSSTCQSNCCPAAGYEEQYVNNYLGVNTTVMYLCGTVSLPQSAVIEGTWTVDLITRSAASAVVLNHSTSLDAVPMFYTADSDQLLCVPTKQGIVSNIEQEYLTEPFLVPSIHFGSAVQRIGVSQTVFSVAFNCSQPKGFLTILRGGGASLSVYDQFSPFRYTSQLSRNVIDVDEGSNAIEYLESTSSTAERTLTAAYRVVPAPFTLRHPLQWPIPSSQGLPSSAFRSLTPMLTLVNAAVASYDVCARSLNVVLQWVPTYFYNRSNATIDTLQVIGACNTSPIIMSGAVVDLLVSTDLNASLYVVARPVHPPTTQPTTTIGTIPEPTATQPVVFLWPVAVGSSAYECSMHVVPPGNVSIFHAVLQVQRTEHTTATCTTPPLQVGPPFTIQASDAAAIMAVPDSAATACPEGLDEQKGTTASVCIPLTDAECNTTYPGARPVYSTAVRRCVPMPYGNSLSALVSVLHLETATPLTPQGSTTAAPGAVAITPSLPWMTSTWLSSMNTTSICGPHGTWNSTAWWCVCSNGWGTDPTQDQWNPSTFMWCNVPLQWLTPQPGAVPQLGVAGAEAFAEAWIRQLKAGNARTVAVTVVGLLLILVVIGFCTRLLCWRRERQRRRSDRRRNRRRAVGSAHRRHGSSLSRNEPLAIEWHRASRLSSSHSCILRLPGPPPREEIDVGTSSTSTNTSNSSSRSTSAGSGGASGTETASSTSATSEGSSAGSSGRQLSSRHLRRTHGSSARNG